MNKQGLPKDGDRTKNSYSSSNKEFDLLKWVEEYSKDDILSQDFLASKEQDELLKDINELLSRQVNEQLGETEVTNDVEKVRKNRNIWKRIRTGIISTLLLFLVMYLFLLSPFGKSALVKVITILTFDKIEQVDATTGDYQNVEDEVILNLDKYTEEELQDTLVDWDLSHSLDGGRAEEGVTNILLLGEEAIESGSGRGRTDLMIIATLNTNTKSIKLTSLMRDTLVRIPGFKDNKLNAAYTIGGVKLLYETIELNFDIQLDGYMLVGFSDFEQIINKLGGVHITLTEAEAAYLRKTNYISDPNNRNVVAGSNVLNGGQALGYCRIRYVATNDNQKDDYGRTSRQRVLLNAIFDKYKTKSFPELVLLMNDILPLIKTDISRGDFEQYLNAGISMGIPDIKNLRIPVKNGYQDGIVRKMAVLIPDISKNIEQLHQFIFEE